jgi:hypothetical protein
MNEALRKRILSESKKYFPLLKKMLTGGRKLKDDGFVTVIRGVKANLADSYKKGTNGTWMEPTSTTRTIDKAMLFLGKTGSRTLFIIDCFRAVDISAFSAMNEDERLILPGFAYTVKSQATQADGLTIIQLEEDPDMSAQVIPDFRWIKVGALHRVPCCIKSPQPLFYYFTSLRANCTL